MPASEHPDPDRVADLAADEGGDEPPLETLLDRLGERVERIASAYGEALRRISELERERMALREAMTASGGGTASPDVEERLSRLATENRRLREAVEEAHARAERIRSRLQVVEDEV